MNHHQILLSVEVCTDCQLKCTECHRDYVLTRGTVNLDPGMFDDVCRQWSQLVPGGRIDLAGAGEPLLHPDFRTVLRTARDHSAQTVLFSNLLTVSDANLDAICEPGGARLKLVLSPHPWQRSRDGVRLGRHMKKFDANLERLLPRIEGRADVAVELHIVSGVQQHDFASSYQRYETDQVRVKIKPFEAFFDAYQIRLPDQEQAFHDGIATYSQDCCYGYSMLYLKPGGDVSLCCIDFDRDAVYGNVKEHSIVDLWNRSRDILKGVDEGRIPKLCRSCRQLGDLRRKIRDEGLQYLRAAERECLDDETEPVGRA